MGSADAANRLLRLDHRGGLCVTETVSWGILYYGFPVMLRPMEAELGWSRVEITGAFSVGLGLAALAALPVGRWIDRRGARALMTSGSCLATALLLVWSRIDSLPALYAVWGLMGLALAATLYEPAFAAVVGWFPTRNRDRALLVVTLAGALASTIFMPIEAWLVTRLGWRHALVTLAGVLAAITIPIHALLLRPAPRSPAPGSGPGLAERQVSGLTLGAAARTAVFWVLAVAFFIGNFTTSAVSVHLIPYLADRGYSPTLAATMIGWMGAMQLPARLLFAPIAARFGHHVATTAIFVGQAVGVAQVALAARLPTLAPMVVVLGASNGMATLARATTVAEIFGARHYGSISGAWRWGPTARGPWRRWPPRSCRWRSATRVCSGCSPPRWPPPRSRSARCAGAAAAEAQRAAVRSASPVGQATPVPPRPQ